MMNEIPTIFCSIDTTDINKAKSIAKATISENCGIKLGLEFFNSNGPQGIKEISDEFAGIPIFLDLKYHDIPNTVASALKSIAPLEVSFVNVHCSGGFKMMEFSANSLRDECKKLDITAPKILGVTILTSFDQKGIEEVGYSKKIPDQVRQMGVLAKKAGLDGVVCSAHEIKIIKEACGDDFITMVPGIRPAGSDVNDQKRTMTPFEAVQAGADHLVIGRPITQAEDMSVASKEIYESIKNAA